jgi:hypothetical protein
MVKVLWYYVVVGKKDLNTKVQQPRMEKGVNKWLSHTSSKFITKIVIEQDLMIIKSLNQFLLL